VPAGEQAEAVTAKETHDDSANTPALLQVSIDYISSSNQTNSLSISRRFKLSVLQWLLSRIGRGRPENLWNQKQRCVARLTTGFPAHAQPRDQQVC
jgi:hypothetical protein